MVEMDLVLVYFSLFSLWLIYLCFCVMFWFLDLWGDFLSCERNEALKFSRNKSGVGCHPIEVQSGSVQLSFQFLREKL